MSSETGKENTSVVDSSLTDTKHDVDNLDDPEITSYKRDSETISSGPQVREQKCNQVTKSSSFGERKMQGTRYFVIKSLNHENLQLSVEKGIWATQLMNEPILEEAFLNCARVILIFSVNMSGFFQGYCQMTSSVGWRRENIWSQGSGKNPWGRSFKVKWLRLYDLPFQKTLHLKNPLNDYKPVKISRDCQELPQDIGEALCDLLDGKDDINANIERDDLLFKRPYVETHCGNMDPQWGPTPMPYPPFFYQNQVEANRFLFAHMPSISSTLTEDEILEMSYEEYLEVHRKRNKRPCHPDTGKSRRTQESMSKERNDDSYSDSRSSKKSYHSTRK